MHKNNQCTSCALQAGNIETIGGLIAASQYFEARQDYAVPIPGFMIIASKPHIQSINDFTAEERHDFIAFVCKVRNNMREALGIQVVTLIQEEDSRHFHVWLFPRYDWMDQFGNKIDSVQHIMTWAKANLNTQENLSTVKQAAESLKISCFIHTQSNAHH